MARLLLLLFIFSTYTIGDKKVEEYDDKNNLYSWTLKLNWWSPIVWLIALFDINHEFKHKGIKGVKELLKSDRFAPYSEQLIINKEYKMSIEDYYHF